MSKFRNTAFAFGVLLVLFSVRSIARADEFSFSFATDPIGCGSYSGGCGAMSGSGIFDTAPVTQTPVFGSVNVYPITGITNGVFNGMSMTLNNPGASAIFQTTLNLPFFGPGVIFTAGGTQYELEFNEGPHPGPANDLLFNLSTGNATSVGLTVASVSVPEPSEIVMILMAVCALVGLSKFKSKAAFVGA